MKKLILLALLAILPVAFTQAADTPKKATTATYHKKVLGGADISLVNADGKAPVTPLRQKKYLFIYFSASWCPPCHRFTPGLVEFYNKNQKDGDFDLLFVSGDRNQEAMTAYMKEHKMPWAGAKWGSKAAKSLQKQYCGPGIPCLVLLDENDIVVADSFAGEEYLGPQSVLKKYEALKEAQKAK
jgi:thiol-disulfide isomerase/thioredoxin